MRIQERDAPVPEQAARRRALSWLVPPAILVAALGGYAASAALAGSGLLVQSQAPYFVLLADGWLHHAWWVVAPFAYQAGDDLTVYHDHLYVSFPPLPGAVMLPFVAAFGTGLSDVAVSVGLGGINALLLALVLRRLPSWGIPMPVWTLVPLVVLFAFGSAVWYTSLA